MDAESGTKVWSDRMTVRNPSEITGPLVLRPKRYWDDRGYFEEAYNKATLTNEGIHCEFVQDNQAFSKIAGTLRGLHFQAPPFAQAKLVRCVSGAALDIIVDVRARSKTYGSWMSVVLSADEGNQIFVPEGFAHGYNTLTDECIIQYKVSQQYNAGSERGIDPLCGDLALDWMGNVEILSDKDKSWPSFSDFNSPFADEVK